MSSSSPRGLLRILCVHGYRQSGAVFRDRTGALRKALKKHAELVYISAPLRIGELRQPGPALADSQATDAVPPQEEDARGWWFSNAQEQTFNAGEVCDSSLGLEESLEEVRRAVREQGPFDGVLGFSQGAALVAMLCALQESGQEAGLGFRFALLVAGFRSLCVAHARFYTPQPLAMPTLHVFGDADRVIPAPLSQDLLSVFHSPQVVTHPGGHYIPAGAAQKRAYIQFLEQFLSKGAVGSS